MSDSYRINGDDFSKASTELKIDQDPFYGWTELNYDEKRTRVKGYGQSRSMAPRSRTGGKYEPGALKIIMYKDTARELREKLAAKAADAVSYGNPKVPITLQYVEPGLKTITVEFVDCAWATKSNAEKEDGGHSMEDVEFDVMYIKENGLTLFDNSDNKR